MPKGRLPKFTTLGLAKGVRNVLVTILVSLCVLSIIGVIQDFMDWEIMASILAIGFLSWICLH